MDPLRERSVMLWRQLCCCWLDSFLPTVSLFHSGSSRSGGRTSYTPMPGGQTPMHGSQTPMYGSRTPMYGSQTPTHGDGMWLAYRIKTHNPEDWWKFSQLTRKDYMGGVMRIDSWSNICISQLHKENLIIRKSMLNLCSQVLSVWKGLQNLCCLLRTPATCQIFSKSMS